ncbi:hypothetical protein BB560_002654, partial [Smittium megazygosporum]
PAFEDFLVLTNFFYSVSIQILKNQELYNFQKQNQSFFSFTKYVIAGDNSSINRLSAIFTAIKTLNDLKSDAPSEKTLLNIIKQLSALSGMINAAHLQYHSLSQNSTQSLISSLNLYYFEIVDFVLSHKTNISLQIFPIFFNSPNQTHVLLSESILFYFVSGNTISTKLKNRYLELIVHFLFDKGGVLYPDFIDFPGKNNPLDLLKKRQSHFIFSYYAKAIANLNSLVWQSDENMILQTVRLLDCYCVENLRIIEKSSGTLANHLIRFSTNGARIVIQVCQQASTKYLGAENISVSFGTKMELLKLILNIFSNLNYISEHSQLHMSEPYKQTLVTLFEFISNSSNLIFGKSGFSNFDLIFASLLSTFNKSLDCSSLRLSCVIFIMDFIEQIIASLSSKFVQHKLVVFLHPFLTRNCFMIWPRAFESSNVVFLSVLANPKFSFSYKYTYYYMDMISDLYLSKHLSTEIFQICYLATIKCCINVNNESHALELCKIVTKPRFFEAFSPFDCIKTYSKSIISISSNLINPWTQELESYLKSNCSRDQVFLILQSLQDIAPLLVERLFAIKS